MVDSELGLDHGLQRPASTTTARSSEELQGHGYRFFSTSDTEVLLKAFHRWGPACVERFLGMFAFAIVERDTGVLTLGRDRLGIKPLYYTRGRGRLRFASSLPALLAGGDVDTAIDPVALHHYMTLPLGRPGAAHDPRRASASCRPATVRTVAARRHVRRPRLLAAASTSAAPSTPACRRPTGATPCSTALRLAVKRRMVADVPVGVLLSGGLDSSLVVGLLAQEGQVGPEDLQRGVPRRRGRGGRRVRVLRPRRAASSPPTTSRSSSTPAGCCPPSTRRSRRWPSRWSATTAWPSTCSRRRSAKSVTVVQSGQGADEVFAGYSWYPPLARRAARAGPRGVRGGVHRPPARRAGPHPGARLAARRRPEPRVRPRALRDARRRRPRSTRRCGWTRRSCWSTTRSSGSTT